jgi:hypothetical protein
MQNNYIGPKKSDCIGSERVEVENPDEAYEIVSETQTPDVPSGKRYADRSRPPGRVNANQSVSRSIPEHALPTPLSTMLLQPGCTVPHNVTGRPRRC